MATSPGWANLGATIAGGNKLNTELAYDQGQSLGAKTADALSQARSRIDENNARANLDQSLQATEPDAGKRAALVALIQSHVDPAQVANYQKTNQETGFRNDIVNPATSDTDAARRAFALNQKGPIQAIGDGNVINELHPVDPTSGAPAVVPTAIGTAIAGQHNAAAQNQLAEAGLHTQQATHPEKFRILPANGGAAAAAYDGSSPLPENETTAQLIAAGQLQAPAPGSRAYIMLGGDNVMKRVNYLAGNQNPQPGAAQTPAPVGAPPAAGAVPPAAGAGGVQPPAAKPFQANFNGNTYAVNRTTANDFARSTGTGGKLDSVNRIAGHLGVLENLYQNLDNKNFVPENWLVNQFKQSTGKQYPGSAQLAAQMIGTEIVKSMTNVGAGGVDERANLATAFGPNGTPEGQKTAIQTASDLVAEQAKDLAMRGATHNIKDIYTPGKYFSPEAIRRYGLVDPNATAPAAAAPAGVTPPAAAGPKAGDVLDGYRFKGGDPSKQASWEKV